MGIRNRYSHVNDRIGFILSVRLELEILTILRSNTIATPLIATAYIGTIMIWSRKAFLQFVKTGLESVGRTTLTCYLIRFILSTFVFYRFGLGLYGYVNRFEQVLTVLSIWIFILIFAYRWLQKFQYGPIE